MPSVISALTLESRIKRKLRDHLRTLGFERSKNGALVAPGSDKNALRSLHRAQRAEKLLGNKEFLASSWPRLRHFFANGNEVTPENVAPVIEKVVSGTWQSDLFRLASLTWSVPVSSGYGRRLRFLVWDSSNEKLIGIFALGDPVFNLRARDQFINWSIDDRRARLVNVLDAYVLGAVQPYSTLLGGKLIACLSNALEVQNEFHKAYGAKTGIISTERKNPKLTLITTTSSLGRSSLYNRLRLNGRSYFNSIGFTDGWGHFHVPNDLFEMMRKLLVIKKHPYSDNHGFGDGPNWRLRTTRAAIGLIGLNPDLMKHGIAREIFVSELASNSCKILRGESKIMRGAFRLTAPEIGELAKNRWIIPRSTRRQDFVIWDREQITSQIHFDSQQLKALRAEF